MNRIPRILILTAHWTRTCDGVVTSIRRISSQLVKMGISVTIFSFDLGQPLIKPIEGRHDEIEVLQFGPSPDRQKNVSKIESSIRRRQVFDCIEVEARKRSIDGILSFYITEAGWLATYLSHSLGIPHVLGIRGSDIGLNIFNPEHLSRIALAVENATAIVCVNEYLRNRLLIAYPQATSKTRIIWNGTDVGDAAQARNETRAVIADETGWSSTLPWAVFIGKPREPKGIRYLLEGMLLLPNDQPLKLLCIGPEPNPLEMRSLGHEWNKLKEIGRLHCTGIKQRSEALQLAAGGDIVVMPSTQDGLSNGLLEGMALGLCPIASDIFSDVLSDKENGLLVPRGDAAALAHALHCAASDSELRNKLARAAQQLVSTRFSQQREAEDYVQCFRSIGL